MFFHQRFVPGLAIASYLVGDEKTKRVAVIDPTRDVDEYIRIASAEGLEITDILETHVHADFVSGARELMARLNGEPMIHSSGMGGADWTPTYADHIVKDGDEIKLGDKVRLRAMHTPGHTPEHVSWALFDDSRSSDTPWLLFTGDFVFVGDVGRPDLLGDKERAELAHQLYESVFTRLAPLPDFTEIFPSHGAGSLCGKAIGSRRSSSLGFERKFNLSMRAKPEAEWAQTLLKGMPLAPPYFTRMKRINKEGPPILGAELPGDRPISARELASRITPSRGEGHSRSEGSSAQQTSSPALTQPLPAYRERSQSADEHGPIILDARSKEAFASAHIPNSISIPIGPQLANWAGWVLPDDQPIVLVVADKEDLRETITQLIRVGFDRIDG
ncbi:MAG: MBL fold metallo-hydrolase, partial [Anaerolineae bacterium]|nr:MBL fold metallo-hydrolase [Phycisphaerae bacterium]